MARAARRRTPVLATFYHCPPHNPHPHNLSVMIIIIVKAIHPLIKMTGETPEVRSDKRKARMLLRHRTSENTIEHHKTS